MSWTKTAQASAAALIAALGLVGLSGCEEHAYPTPSAAEAAPAPPSAPADLMGAPDGQGAPPLADSTLGAYAASPPGPDAAAPYPPQGQPSPQQYAQGPSAYGPSEAPNRYSPGPYPSAAPQVISNAPIPNPPEHEGYRSHGRRHGWVHGRIDEGAYTGPGAEGREQAGSGEHHHARHVHHAALPAYEYRVWRHGHWVYEPAPAPAHRTRHVRHGVAAHGTTHHHHRPTAAHAKLHAHHGAARTAHAHHAGTAHAAHAHAAHPAVKHAVHPAIHHAHATKPAAAAAATTAARHGAATTEAHKIAPLHTPPSSAAVVPLPKVTAPEVHKPKLPTIVPAAPNSSARSARAAPHGVTTGNTAKTPVSAADQAARLQTLQTAMTDVVSREGQLKAPTRFTANQPAEVSLTLPASFARRLQDEAAKATLAQAAQTVNVTSVLSGEGFTVTPDQAQYQPLTPDQPVQFKWKVTAQPGAKGPLHADVSADLLGSRAAQNLPLGSLNAIAGVGGGVTGRVVGISLLVLIAAIIIGWMSQRRRRREPIGAIRPRSNHHGGDIETSV